MVAVAHLSPDQHHRLVVVRSRPAPVLHAAQIHQAAPVLAATYRRRRLVAAGLVAAVVLSLSLAAQGVLGAFGGGPLSVAERPGASGPVYVVQPGDTFWDIARMLRPDDDPRPLVARLVAAHGSPVLRAGERVALPDGA